MGKDQIFIASIYNDMLINERINAELEREYNRLINEDAPTGDELQGKINNAVGNVTGGQNPGEAFSNWVTNNNADLTANMGAEPDKWVTMFTSNIDFLKYLGVSLVASYITGKVLMSLAEWLTKKAEKGEKMLDVLMAKDMPRQAKEIKKLTALSHSNPAEYKKRLVDIEVNTKKGFADELRSRGIRTEKGPLPVVLDRIGAIINAATDPRKKSVIIGWILFIIYKLGGSVINLGMSN